MTTQPDMAQALADLAEKICEAARAIERAPNWQAWSDAGARWRRLIQERARYVSPAPEVDSGTQPTLEFDA